jgi:hypothetical protein
MKVQNTIAKIISLCCEYREHRTDLVVELLKLSSFGQCRGLGQHHLYLAQFFISASKLVDRQQLIGKDRLKFCCNIHSYKFIWEILE